MDTDKTIWVKFIWNLDHIDNFIPPKLPGLYHFRIADTESPSEIIDTILTAYYTDPVWSKIINEIKPRMKDRINSTYNQPHAAYLLIKLWDEIIGVSGISRQHYTGQNLLTGICIKPEHQRKGLGKFLLFQSLTALKATGLKTATVFTEEGSVADKKIYLLFGSTRFENVEYLTNHQKN
jgi:N-acetylglutamate synthase-like GNAT family acetyltransferase